MSEKPKPVAPKEKAAAEETVAVGVQPSVETPRDQREGAPRTETPERPAEPPEETTRDEEAPLETPESPARREETRLLSREEWALMDSLAVPAPAESEVSQLHRRVSQSPVDAHAPAWPGRAPNSP